MNATFIFPCVTVAQDELDDPPRKWEISVNHRRHRRAYADRDTAIRKARELWALETILGAGFAWEYEKGQQLLARPREGGGPIEEPFICNCRIVDGVGHFLIPAVHPLLHDPVEALVRFAGVLLAMGEA